MINKETNRVLVEMSKHTDRPRQDAYGLDREYYRRATLVGYMHYVGTVLKMYPELAADAALGLRTVANAVNAFEQARWMEERERTKIKFDLLEEMVGTHV